MKKFKIIILIVVLLFVNACFTSCFQRDFEEILYIDDANTNAIVSSLANVYNSYFIDSVAINNNTPYKFKSDIYIYATVSADDKNGNLYKSVYVQDTDYGINVRIISKSGNNTGLYEGDSIRINLKNTILSDYHGIKQLDSVDVDINVLKIANNRYVNPILVEGTNVTDDYICKLVKLQNVEFLEDEIGKVYAEENTSGADRLIESCGLSGTLIVRTSGYANFASSTIPKGKGYIIGILSKYNNNFQLIIRKEKEVVLNKLRCGVTNDFFIENFDNQTVNADLLIPNWINVGNFSSKKWTIAAINGGNPAAKIKNDSPIDTTWLVLPKLEVPSNSRISFETITLNPGTCKLELLYSTSDIPSNTPKNATWSLPIATINSNGTIDEAIPVGNYHIAIRFIGSSAASSNTVFYIDNIKAYEEEN